MSISNVGANDVVISSRREVIAGTASLGVHLDSQIAGEDLANDVLKTEERFSYYNITTTASTNVKSGAGFLHTITLNQPRNSTCTLIFYDNTAASGTQILKQAGTATDPQTYLFDVSFSTGLTFAGATSTTTADMTVSYR